MITFLLSGWIADTLSFQWGYAAIFALGALGLGMSTYHLHRLKPPPVPQFQIRPMRDQAQPGRGTGQSGDVPQRMSIGTRLWLRWRPSQSNFFAEISNRYWWVMLAFFLFHFTQLLPTALFPLFWVREINLADWEIGILNALFYLLMLMFAPLLEPLTKYLGNYRLVVIGSVLLALYPLITAFSIDLTLILVASVVGGIVWAILSGALVNRLLEVTPEDKRPSHMAIYNLALNTATLSSTMLGPLMADIVGLREALFIIFVLRVGSGLAMARWG
jgi:Na+/melibiose symporter-like transporter